MFLGLGWWAIKGRGPFAARGRDEALHKRCMLTALTLSTVFLASYLEYHAEVGHVPFWGEGWIETLYRIVLIPHVVLALLMVPPIVLLVVAALLGRLDTHRRLARWTLPVWLYVSVTGVAVYVLNHALRPG